MDVDSPGDDQFDFGWLAEFALDPATVASLCDAAPQPGAAVADSTSGRGAGGGGDALGELFASCASHGRQETGSRRGDVVGSLSGGGGLVGHGGGGRDAGGAAGGGGSGGGGMEDDEISAMARMLLLEDTTMYPHAHVAAAAAERLANTHTDTSFRNQNNSNASRYYSRDPAPLPLHYGGSIASTAKADELLLSMGAAKAAAIDAAR